MRDAKSRVRDEKELVVYSGTRNQDHLQTTGCVGAVLGPVELVTCILVEWERRLIFNIFNIFNISVGYYNININNIGDRRLHTFGYI